MFIGKDQGDVQSNFRYSAMLTKRELTLHPSRLVVYRSERRTADLGISRSEGPDPALFSTKSAWPIVDLEHDVKRCGATFALLPFMGCAAINEPRDFSQQGSSILNGTYRSWMFDDRAPNCGR